MNALEKFVKNTEGKTREVLEELVHTIAGNIQEIKKLNQHIEYYQHEIKLLKKKLFGSSSEKLLDTQIHTQNELQIFNEFELIGEQVELEEKPQEVVCGDATKKRDNKPGRKLLPKHLPRITVEHDLNDAEKICVCGTAMECIGTQKSEELSYIPAKLQVIEHHCKKYICSCCAKKKEENPAWPVRSLTAKKPPQLIEKSFASPGLLAQIAVAKFCDHLPLYRQEQLFGRLSIALSRQTMSQWMLQVGKAIVPLINLMQETILDYDIAFADETTIQVLNEPNRRAQTKSYMWCFLGGPPNQRVVIYQYHPTRSGEIPLHFFDGYQGALHCDGYSGYEALLKSEGIIGLACMAHVRRKFIEALPNGKEKGVSGHVIRMIRQFYRIEESLRVADADQVMIKATRQEKSKPLLEQLKSYLDQKSSTVLPSGLLGKAIAYTLKRWAALITYLQDGRYEIDNNRTERAIKPFVCGRKNWLFADSVTGAHASARLYSLIETAKAHQINPMRYLTYIFKELPNCKHVTDFEKLLPYHVKDLDFFKNSTEALLGE